MKLPTSDPFAIVSGMSDSFHLPTIKMTDPINLSQYTYKVILRPEPSVHNKNHFKEMLSSDVYWLKPLPDFSKLTAVYLVAGAGA